ncbi:MAG: ARMT1-like domain-containing protein [Candidatus Methanoplasma sp.]|nr:ARMT1-like domain-containing protein [Candidatus Methanoplasma sp.]
MKVSPDCVPCLMRRVFFQSLLPENGRERESVEAGLKTYAENIAWNRNSAELATIVHRSAYEALGVTDPYHELKVRADDIASGYLDRVEKFVDSSDDRFTAAVRVSIIGNVMDFGSGISIDDPDEFEGMFESLLEQGVGSDDTEVLRDLVGASDTVLYLFDNCGESQFDKVLIRELKRSGKRVVGVVKGKPILNDVTREDAERIGLDKELDRVLTTNTFAIGINIKEIGEDLRDEIKRAGVAIAKGMANFESLSDEDIGIPVVYLLRAKCIPVAGLLGVEVGTNVVRVQSTFRCGGNI